MPPLADDWNRPPGRTGVTMARHVLIVSYFFPPMGGVGCLRALKLAKFLPRFGWEASILTTKVPAYYCYDETLEGELPAGTRVLRSGSADPFRAYARIVGAPRPG